jgi:chemotaxis signal transduction protein
VTVAVEQHHQVLAARAAELARPLAEDAAEQQVLDVLLLSIGEQQVAVPLDALQGVRAPQPLTAVPGASGVLAGVIGGRGDAVAVASLAALLGLAASSPPDQQWVVVLDDAAPLGLLADTADEIVRLHSSDLTVSDDATLVAALAAGGILVLDPAAVLRDPRLFLHQTDATEEPTWHEA